jgi:hypothetical protein
MGMIEEAFAGLYPEREYPYLGKITYSGKFSDYNANIRLQDNCMTFNLSKKWKEVDRDIRIGLLQVLLTKMMKKELSRQQPKKTDKKTTLQMDLYQHFIKSLHLGIIKDKDDPHLSASFERVNALYFNHQVEKPNLVWGKESIRKLGHYNYQTDTIMLSKVFHGGDTKFIDLVMHHEILHKHLQFFWKPGRSYYHTPEFRKKEKEFKDFEQVERELERFLAKKKVKRWFFG